MGALLFYTLGVFLFTLSSANHESCPDDASISPCNCDAEGVSCMKATTADQIKKAFQTNFPYGGIRGFWLQQTNITTIPSSLFGNVKVQNIYIEVNKVTTVQSGAFRGSESVLQTLSLYGNEMKSFPFQDLKSFSKLAVVNFAKNQLESIPANAFSNNIMLSRVILAENKINFIGVNAFVGPRAIQDINLMQNSLRSLGDYSLATSTQFPFLQINLQLNQISDVSYTAFQGSYPHVLLLGGNQLKSLSPLPFQPMIQSMVSKPQPGGIDVTGNPFTCCGNDYVWIISNKYALANALYGFQCTDGRFLHDLTYNDIICRL